MTTTLALPALIPGDWTTDEWEALIAALTRRQLIGGGLALGLLTACGGSTATPTPAANATRPVQTPMGEIQVPVRPQRVVAIGAGMSLQVADNLGAALVAAGAYVNGNRIHVSDAAKALPVIESSPEVDIEAVAAARPDLIITGTEGDYTEIYDRLSAIAPTVLVYTTTTRGNWRDSIMIVADALNQRDEATKRLAAVDARVDELGKAIKVAWPSGVKVSVLRMSAADGSVRSYRTGSGRIGIEILGKVAGVTINGDTLPGDPAISNVTISAERVREVDADVILYFGDRDPTEASKAIGSATSNPLWGTLTGVQAGRASMVANEVWFDGFGFTAINLVIDDLFKYLGRKS